MISPGVSVVICCYNSSTRLPETFRHLARQSLSASVPWEVIIAVDQQSTDNTAEAAEDAWKENGAPAPIRVIVEERAGRGAAIHAGFTAARYEVLVTVDDDNWLD